MRIPLQNCSHPVLKTEYLLDSINIDILYRFLTFLTPPFPVSVNFLKDILYLKLVWTGFYAPLGRSNCSRP